MTNKCNYNIKNDLDWFFLGACMVSGIALTGMELFKAWT